MRGRVCNLLLQFSLTIAAGPCQRCHSRVQVPQNLRQGSISVASYESQGYGGGIPTRLHTGIQRLKPRLSHDRRLVGQSVLVSGHHVGLVTNFSFSSTEIIYRHWIFYYGALSLRREWVCNLLVQVLPGLARAVILGFKSPRTWDHTLLPNLRLSSLSVATNDSQGYDRSIPTRLHRES
jgi:hypothetical protein